MVGDFHEELIELEEGQYYDDDKQAFYNFTYLSPLQAAFGFADGALNAFPKGGFLSKCGLNLKGIRYELLNFTETAGERRFIESIDFMYASLGYVYDINYY